MDETQAFRRAWTKIWASFAGADGGGVRGRTNSEREDHSQPIPERDGLGHQHRFIRARGFDECLGRITNNNLAEYYVPANADIGRWTRTGWMKRTIAWGRSA